MHVCFGLEWTISATIARKRWNIFRNRYGREVNICCPKRVRFLFLGKLQTLIFTDLPWSLPCLFCESGIHRKRNYGFTRSTRPITAHERTAICKSQLEAITKKPSNTRGVGTSVWSLLRRRTIPGFSFVCNGRLELIVILAFFLALAAS